jgi:alpha-galactosidase
VTSLSNSHFQFAFDSATGQWSLTTAAGLRITGARLAAPASVEAPITRASVHGPLAVLRARLTLAGCAADVEFALPEAYPFLMWRITLRNESQQPVYLNDIDLLRLGSRLDSQSAVNINADSFFVNGYQSWSFSGALQKHQRQPGSLFGPLGDPKRLNLASPRPSARGHFVSELFGVLGDAAQNAAVLVGFLSQREHFGAVEARLDSPSPSLRLTAQFDGVSLAPGQSRATDWAYLQFIAPDAFDPLADYAEAVARENAARVPAHTPVGWCSWYHYFDKVTEPDVLSNLDAIAKTRETLPLDFVQLDDGFQAQVGDWFETNAKFPHGLRWLTEHIRARGQTPGLWLAPYIVRSDAKLLHEHPDWFLRTADGKLANAGFNWNKWCYGLDPTHPEVRAHVRRLITTAVTEWGFPYLKLDFLYAAALPAQRYDASLTRAQAMRLALEDIRAAAGPDTFLLGCGCPLGPAIGLVDGLRISTDVAPDWAPQLFHPLLAPLLKREQEFVSTRNALRNTIVRAPLHRRWWLNDPDCLMVRDRDTRLTDAQVQSLASVIALSGGMFLLSDDMARLPTARRKYIAPLLPVLTASARPRDWLTQTMPDTVVLPMSNASGEWFVIGIFNWDDSPHDCPLNLLSLGLPTAAAYHVSDFWERRQWRVARDEAVLLRGVAAQAGHLIAVRPVVEGPQFIASTFHFSQGGEITDWEASSNQLRFTIALGRVDEGAVRLVLPAAPRSATADGQAVGIAASDGLYALRCVVNRAAHVTVEW